MSNDILIVTEKIGLDQLKALCRQWFDDMVKIVVDLRKELAAIGGELHADAEALLVKNGSEQEDIWGANIYPWQDPEHRIEYTALINIRPRVGNSTMEIEDERIRAKMKQIIEKLIIGSDERLV